MFLLFKIFFFLVDYCLLKDYLKKAVDSILNQTKQLYSSISGGLAGALEGTFTGLNISEVTLGSAGLSNVSSKSSAGSGKSTDDIRARSKDYKEGKQKEEQNKAINDIQERIKNALGSRADDTVNLSAYQDILNEMYGNADEAIAKIDERLASLATLQTSTFSSSVNKHVSIITLSKVSPIAFLIAAISSFIYK